MAEVSPGCLCVPLRTCFCTVCLFRRRSLWFRTAFTPAVLSWVPRSLPLAGTGTALSSRCHLVGWLFMCPAGCCFCSKTNSQAASRRPWAACPVFRECGEALAACVWLVQVVVSAGRDAWCAAACGRCLTHLYCCDRGATVHVEAGLLHCRTVAQHSRVRCACATL
jgi:hypothetical protein